MMATEHIYWYLPDEEATSFDVNNHMTISELVKDLIGKTMLRYIYVFDLEALFLWWKAIVVWWFKWAKLQMMVVDASQPQSQ